MQKNINLLLVLFFVFSGAVAQNRRIEKIDSHQGLSQNDVKSFFQDSDGFLWVGTNDGLNRYDGISFKKYIKAKNQLASGIISNLVEDNHKNLWCVTVPAGINRINLVTGKVEEFLYASSIEDKSLMADQVLDLKKDSKGVLWYLTIFGVGKIETIDGETRVTNFYRTGNLNKEFSEFYIDSKDRIFILNQDDLILFENGEFKKLSVPFVIKKILQYKNVTYLVTNRGFKCCDLESLISGSDSDFEQVLGGSIFDLAIGKNNQIWLLNNKGLWVYPLNDEGEIEVGAIKMVENGLSVYRSVSLYNLFVDNTGVIYVGTSGEGILKINPKENIIKYFTLKHVNDVGKIRTIVETKDKKIYVGRESGEMSVFRKELLDSPSVSYIEDVEVIEGDAYDIKEVRWGNGKYAILGAGNYINSFRVIKGDHIDLPLIANVKLCLVQDKDEFIWVGTYNEGLYKIDPNGKVPIKKYFQRTDGSGLLSNIIRSLMLDSKGNLWIGTAKGINIITAKELKKNNPNIKSIVGNPEDPKSLSHNYILPIYEARNKEIWIGTMGGGLNHMVSYDGENSAVFEHYDHSDGLPNNVIKSILEDEAGFIWVSTNVGLSRIDSRTNKIENYDENDGLEEIEFSEMAETVLSDGRFVFGAFKGFNVFDPLALEKDTSKAIPVFTKVVVLNRDVEVGDTINGKVILNKDINSIDEFEIDYINNSITIQFASLHYEHPIKNKCRYKLEGFDNQWIEDISGGLAKYTNLKPGAYKFRLQAANNDGLWNNKEKVVSFIVKPPFWLTNFMKIMYIIMALLILLFFRRFSLIGVQRKHQLVLNELEKENEEKVTQMKFQFFMNISHEFKTPLTLIVNPLEQLVNSEVIPSEDKLRHLHKVMLRNGKVLLRLINQLMDFRKAELGILKLKLSERNLKEFLEDIYNSFSPIALKKDIDFKFASHSLLKNVWFDADKLEKVVNNILSNAFKYTEEGGEISLELIDDGEKFITIIISDNGSGIPESAQGNIFNRFFQVDSSTSKAKEGSGIGLAYAKSLIDLMKGKIEFKSKEDEGTVFFIRIPRDKDVYKNDDVIFSEVIERSYTDEKTSTFPELEIDGIEQTRIEEVRNEDDELCTLLIVEDNIDLSNYLSDYFSSHYNVIVAENGREGIEKCEEYNPDIVITDVAMPEMNGNEMTEILKSSVETSHIPIIMLSAQSSDEQQKTGLEVGADVYLSKPFNLQLLSAQVFSLLKNRQNLRAKFREKINMVPSEISPSNKDEKLLKKMLDIVEENMANPDFTVQKLATECGFSQNHLNNKLFALTGQKSKIFIRSIRLKRACQLLIQTDDTVSEITYSVGFNDLQYFRKCFNAEYGCSPKEYRRRNSKE